MLDVLELPFDLADDAPAAPAGSAEPHPSPTAASPEPIAEEICDDLELPTATTPSALPFAKDDFVRVRGEVGSAFRVMRIDEFPDEPGRPTEVTVYGGTRKKDEWIAAAWRSFTADRVVEVLETRMSPNGGQVVVR